MMRIYITRHGQTDWNYQRIIQGKTDIPLNDTGRSQAQITRDELKETSLDLIISSPLMRAYETAQIINEAHQVPIVIDERVEERGFGDLEGASISDVDFTCFWRVAHEDKFPSCEKTSAFYERVHSFIDEAKVKYKNQNILVVAHGGVSLPFYTYFHGLPDQEDMREFMLNNCEVACYEIDE